MLGLRSNQVGDRGAAALAKGRWRRLEVLELGCNNIGDAGVKALVASPLGRHVSVLTFEANRHGQAGRALLRRRRARPWPAAEEGESA